MTLIYESEISRKNGEILLPVRQTIEGGRDADSIPKLRERHPRGSRKDTADMKA
jgi:hypothetical protein